MTKNTLLFTFTAAIALLLPGCMAPTREETFAPRPPARDVLRAEALFNNGQVRDAVFACVEIARKNPDTAGLAELQAKIQRHLAAHRTASFETVNNTTHAVGMSDARKYQNIPPTYNMRRHVQGETDSLKSEPTPMQKIINTPVTVDLEDADLNAIIAEIGRSQNINIIADANLSDSTVTMQMRDVPLIELLEYIGRNMGVSFHVGSNMIWVTAADPDAETGAPLETRVYRLRKGLVPMEMTSAVGSAGTPNLIDAIERFVNQPPGADLLWDDRVHALFIKNTRENLRLAEGIIDMMDVAPIQVSIAARFMTVEQVDTRELGIDWLVSNQRAAASEGGFFPRLGNRPPLARNSMDGAINNSAGGGVFAFQSILGRFASQAVFHALEESGKSQMLAQPRITTLNNHPAEFFKGEIFYWYEDYDLQSYSTSAGSGFEGSSSSGTSLVPTGTPQERELGYTLVATPSVGADLASINLLLSIEISSFKNWEYFNDPANNNNNNNATPEGTSAGAMKLPNFLESRIETQVNVRSGETIILGGMIDTQQSVTVRGVPVLSSLPLIGRFFRTEIKENKPSNLLIFVTATIISDTGEELVSINPQVLPGLPLPADYYDTATVAEPEAASDSVDN